MSKWWSVVTLVDVVAVPKRKSQVVDEEGGDEEDKVVHERVIEPNHPPTYRSKQTRRQDVDRCLGG